MSQGEEREHVELGSAEDMRLERLLEDLHTTVTTLALSLKAVQRQPSNVVYRASADQQAQFGRGQIQELLGFPAVLHAEDAAHAAVRGIEEFLELEKQTASESTEAQLRQMFAEVVSDLFDPTRADAEERPCEAICSLLAAWVEVPEPPPVEELPVPAPIESGAPKVILDWEFDYDDPEAPRPFLGKLLLAIFEHVRGFDEKTAASRLHAQALIGFDQSLQAALGEYRGPVTFRILQDGDSTPRMELLRRHSPTVR